MRDEKKDVPADARASHQQAGQTAASDGGMTSVEAVGTQQDAVSRANPAGAINRDVLPEKSRLQGSRDLTERPSEKSGRGAADRSK